MTALSTREQARTEDAPCEPIAVIGMGCRFPGGVCSPEDLWEVVAAERDVLGEFPADRGWDLGRLFGPAGERGTSYLRRGGFLPDAAEFDAAFFGISPREALAMDPQQRLLLETTWEAIERAGIDPLSLAGSPTSVFAGVIPQQYDSYVQQADDDLEGYIYTGNTPSVLAGRIAYTLGLLGPALPVDTACSSSLVALHLACQSLRLGECSLALAGGVTVMSTPMLFVEFSRQGALSSDGRSKAFSAEADGTGWSEGVGMVVLERLSGARHNGHQVLAVIRGSAVNEDGASNGLTAPHGPAQQRLIRQALASARLSTADVDVVEAHGPGTRLGDPIEANALLATYGAGRDPDAPLWLGSVKSNLGHTQAAAGVAGVIKMVMALRHGTLPRSLHVDQPTRQVDWSSGTVRVLSSARPWPRLGRPRRAGVSAFGAGGTNAHLILEAAPAESLPATEVTGPLLWPLSAKTARALADHAQRLHDHLLAHPETSGADVSRTLAARSAFAHRAVVTGTSRADLLAGLRDISAFPPLAIPDRPDSRPVFVFPGQGSQWAGMADGLLDEDPVFTASVQDCAAVFERYLDWSLLDVLRGEPGAAPLDRVEVAQPALFAMMVSLAAVWRSRGVEPAAVVGHSQGEIAAAYVAGAVSLADAAMIIAVRSRALQDLAGQGAMAAIALPPDRLLQAIRPWRTRLEIAAINGPASTTVGGEPAALDELVDMLSSTGVRYRRLPGVANAGHSIQVESLREHLMSGLAGVSPGPSTVPFYSAVTGGRLATETLDVTYWWRNAREPVLFEPATRALLAAGHRLFLEVNPHPLLQSALEETIADAGVAGVVLGTLRRGEAARDRLRVSVAEAYRQGCPVDWSAEQADSARLTALPTYPFQPKRYWCHPVHGSTEAAHGHPLVTADLPLPHTGGHLLTAELSTGAHPWLADHALLGNTLLPGTAVVELAWAAAERVGCTQVAELVLDRPLPLPEDGSVVHIQVASEPSDGKPGAYDFVMLAQSAVDGPWIRYAHGALTGEPAPVDPWPDAAAWPPAGAVAVDVTEAYPRLRDAGYEYGPAFQGLRELWRRGGELFAEATVAEDQRAARYGVHPALLDAGLHAILLESATGHPAARMPFSWTAVRLHRTGASTLRMRIRTSGHDEFSLTAADMAGQPVISVAALQFRPVPERPVAPASLARVVRTPVTLPSTGSSCALVGQPHPGLPGIPVHPTLAGLLDALGTRPCPGTVIVRLAPQSRDEPTLPALVHTTLADHLQTLKTLLADPDLATIRLVLLTEHATTETPDLMAATVRALWQSASAEHPHRITVLDTDATPASHAALPAAIGTDVPDVALYQGVAHIPALQSLTCDQGLTSPAGTAAWKLSTIGTATPGHLALVAAPEYEQPLLAGQVRVAVRAAGLNFVDVLTRMGLFPGEAGLGHEFAGVVTDVGSAVTGMAAGDRVMGIVGLTASAVAPVVVTDHRLVTTIPAAWTYAQAAGVPVAFLTALYGLGILAKLQQGDSLLVHAAAGGVGMAALQLARHWGAEVFATAHPDKWGTLTELGVDAAHIASSRTLEFEQQFASATAGRGIDVVLNSLTREFVDASLRLVREGGRFMEMGKLDIRPEHEVGSVHPTVSYQPFDILSVDPDLIADLLAELRALFGAGVLRPLPVRAWDVSKASDAFRTFRDARHTGKLVITFPTRIDPEGTVLITGGTGTLGAAVARHLVTHHGVKHLVLASRRGPDAPAASHLQAELGATVVACDLTDPDQAAALLASMPAEHPLTAIVHAAGVLRDATITSLTAEDLAAVLAPKLDAAWHLHQLTRHLDQVRLILFSSVAGSLGTPGQANYAAANAFLDALARHRASAGQPATAIAWGLWTQPSEMSRHLGKRDIDRLATAGVAPLSTADGLALFDAALACPEPALVAANRTSVRAQRPGTRARLAEGNLQARLAALPVTERNSALLTWVREQAVAVLRLPSVTAVSAGVALRDLGFDSLTSVELRNRLNAATGLRLPVTVVFDYPTPSALAEFVRGELFASVQPDNSALLAEVDRVSAALDAEPSLDGALGQQVAARFEAMLARLRPAASATPDPETASTDELFRLIDTEFGHGDQ